MKQLFLLSKHFSQTFNNKLIQALSKSPEQINLLFCMNAADQKNDDPMSLEYIRESWDELKSCGYKLEVLDLKDYINKSAELLSMLKQFDGAFFTGGNYMTLLDYFYKTGLVNEYPKLLETGFIHIGASAGAMIFSPTMKYYKDFIDKEYVGEFHNEGLNLFPHYIVPHYASKPKYTKIFEDLVKQFENEKVHFIPLTNDQAVCVQDKTWEIL
jgi:dipeptidase E